MRFFVPPPRPLLNPDFIPPKSPALIGLKDGTNANFVGGNFDCLKLTINHTYNHGIP